MKALKILGAALSAIFFCWLSLPVIGYATVLLANWETTIESECVELTLDEHSTKIEVEGLQISRPAQSGLKLIQCAYGSSRKRVYYRLRGEHHTDHKRLLFCSFAIESPTILKAAKQALDRQQKIKSVGTQDMRRISWIEYPKWWPRLGVCCDYFADSLNLSFMTDLSDSNVIYRTYLIDELGDLSAEPLLW